MNETESARPPIPPPLPRFVEGFRNRRGAMIGNGVFFALFGLVAAIVGFLFLAGGLEGYESAGRSYSRGNRFGSLLLLTLGSIQLPLGFMCFVLGIGSARCRRWARALLAAGLPVFAVVSMLVLVLGTCYFPWLMSHMDFRRGQGVLFVILGVVVAMALLVINVLIPWFAGRFYSGEDARLTCEEIQSKPSWTDRCPQAVLRFGFVVLVVGFLWLAFIPLWIVPFVGFNFVGPPATAFSMAMFLIHVWLMKKCWQQKKSAWWSVIVLWIVSLSIAFVCLPFRRLWLIGKNDQTVGGIPRIREQLEEHLAMLTEAGMPLMNGTVLFLLIAGAIFLGLGTAMKVKTYFDSDPIDVPPVI